MEAHLRSVGREGHEGMALWIGVQTGREFAVTETLLPKQRHIRTDDGVCVVIEADELHRLNVLLYRRGLTLLGQIHSHPGRAYHSDTDDLYAIATTVGCLSLVVPNFARAPFRVRDCATYRLDARGHWAPVASRDAAEMIVVED